MEAFKYRLDDLEGKTLLQTAFQPKPMKKKHCMLDKEQVFSPFVPLSYHSDASLLVLSMQKSFLLILEPKPERLFCIPDSPS